MPEGYYDPASVDMLVNDSENKHNTPEIKTGEQESLPTCKPGGNISLILLILKTKYSRVLNKSAGTLINTIEKFPTGTLF